MDKLVETALREVASRHPEDNEAAQRAVATEIAMGALRYFLLKFTRTTVIAFDFQEALSFEGETGPYVQYAAVRARNIFRKLEERGEAKPEFAAELTREAMARQLASEECWQILLAASKADSAVDRAVTAGRTGARGEIRFPACADVQQFLSSISGAGRTGPRAQSLPALDDRILPRATGAHAGHPRHRAFRHTCSRLVQICCSPSTPGTPTSPSAFSRTAYWPIIAACAPSASRLPTSGESCCSSLLRFASLDPTGDRRHHHFLRRAAAEQRAGRDVAALFRHAGHVRDGRDRYRASRSYMKIPPKWAPTGS